MVRQAAFGSTGFPDAPGIALILRLSNWIFISALALNGFVLSCGARKTYRSDFSALFIPAITFHVRQKRVNNLLSGDDSTI
jgi:hypothetical protein